MDRMGVPGAAWIRGLSPRRRAIVGVFAVLTLLIASMGVGGWLIANRGAGGPTPPQDQPGPVLLVPGYGGGTGALEVLADALRATGRAAEVVLLPDGGTGDLNRQADALDAAVRQRMSDGAPSVDVIGYSAGGVVARLWAQDHDGQHRARRIVTLGSPHHGTTIAAAGAALAPDACPTACQQLVPGSRLLSRLDRPVPTPPRWLSIWTAQDQTVTPPDSARLTGAVNVTIQHVCPQEQVSHSQLPTDPVVTTLVEDAIGAGPIEVPTSQVCAPA
jgi:pimeloyl-ACP methyl ester carboxylesterase